MKRRNTLAASAAVALATLSLAAAPKAILSSWDLNCARPDQILANADKFDRLAIDGVSIALRETCEPSEELTGYQRVSCGRSWSRDDLRKFVPTLRGIAAHKSMKESLLTFFFMPTRRLAWTDDAAWRSWNENMASVAWLAREGGLKGLLLDTEDYWRSYQFDLRPSDGLSFDAAAALARRRGAEMFKLVFAEHPEIAILTYWWLSRHYGYTGAQDPKAAVRGAGDLLVPFTDGLLDVMPPTVRFVDGNEHTYHWVFTRNYADNHISNLDAVAPENRRKYRACMGAGAALYLDMYANPKGSNWYRPPIGGRRLNAFLDRYEDATLAADDYVWLWGEKHSCIDWEGIRPSKRYEVAYTNGTWDAALPGFNEEFAILRNPRGELIPRLRALKRSGKAVNLAGEVKSTGKFSRTVDVKGVRYGEWYAVLVETKGRQLSANCGLKIGDDPIWTRPTASVVFGEPAADGTCRGIAFQRVWGDADGLYVNVECRPWDRGRELDDVKVSVYRVFAPGGDGEGYLRSVVTQGKGAE